MDPKMLVSELAELMQVTHQALHNQLKRKKLTYRKTNNRVYFGHETSKLLLALSFHPQIISFQIVKGGTGKTTLCLSVGIRSSLYGAKTLLIDLDQQGNLTKACNVHAHDKPIMIEIINQDLPIQECIIPVCDGVDIIPSRIENSLLDSNLMLKRLPLDRVLKDMITPLKQSYDLILIDCPPALGSSVTAATLASDKVISPVTPSEFSLEGLQITTSEINRIEKAYKKTIPVHAVLNEFDGRNSLSHDTLRFLMTSETHGSNLMRTVVRKCQEFENVLSEKKSLFDGLKNNMAKEDIDLLAREILGVNNFSKNNIKRDSVGG